MPKYSELRLVQFDEVFGLPASAVERLVDMLGRSGPDAGDDERMSRPLVVASIRAQARRSVFHDLAR
jgi:hypothetical protein